MPIKRFAFFWIADYVLAVLVVYVITLASVSIFHLPQLRYVVLLFVPISTLLFSWLFYRGTDRVHAHRLIIAATWTVLAMIVDGMTGWFTAQASPLLVFTSPLLLAVYGSKLLAVFVGAYLGAPVGERLKS